MTSSSGGPSGPGPGISINYEQQKGMSGKEDEKNKNAKSNLSNPQASAWMEKLRNKSASLKSLQDLSKSVRAALLDRRQVGALDGEDKAILRKSLDTLSESIPVKGAASMAERLEAIARKMGRNPENGQNKLSFMEAPAHGCFFLSTEMFYVEINIDSASGMVKEGKIHHIDTANGQTSQAVPSAQQNCVEMIQCLNSGDFGRFIKHLEGLMLVYDLKGNHAISAPQKSMAWNSLSILERDLEMVYNSYRNWSMDPDTFIHNTPLGLLQPRTGGICMQLRYFLPPYHLLKHGGSVDSKLTGLQNKTNMSTMTLDEISLHEDIGYSATVGIETSPRPNLLPTGSLYALNKQHGGTLDPIPLGPNNSVTLYVRFALQFDQPIPLSVARLKQISQLTEIHHEALSSDKTGPWATQPLMELIIKNCTQEQLNPTNNRGLFVTLPDQQHCYFLSEHSSLKGVLVSSIPFRHPSQIPEILEILRQQALFNTLIESCARSKSIQDLESSIMFEISATDIQALTITFEVPAGMTDSGSLGYEEAMMSVQLDLLSNVEVKSTIFCTTPDICPENFLDQPIQRSLSIPVAMRSIIRFCQMKRLKHQQENERHQQQTMHDPITGIKLEPTTDSLMDFKYSVNQCLEEDQKMDARNGNSSVANVADQYMQQQNQFLMDGENNVQPLQAPGSATVGSEQFQQTGIKSEPMDYETTGGINDSNGKYYTPSPSDPLNAFGPQDIAFRPGASATKKVGTAGITNSTVDPIVMRNEQNLLNNHRIETMEALTSKKNVLTEHPRLMEAHANRKTTNISSSVNSSNKDGMAEPVTNNNKGHKASQNISSVGNQARKKLDGIKVTLKGSSIPQNIKPSVSITPVSSSSRHTEVGPGNGILCNDGNLINKKGNTTTGGIEIIPLGHHHSSGHHSSQAIDKSSSKATKNPKDIIRRSLSENDSTPSSSSGSKKKLSKQSGGSGGQGALNSSGSSKKIRHIADLERKSSKSGDKKHTSSGSTYLKRSSHSLSPNNHGGKSAKLSSTLSIAKAVPSSTSPQFPASSGGIEIIPAMGGASQHSTSPSAKSHSSSYSNMHIKDKSTSLASKSSSSGLKVAIKGSSSSSEGKNRSEHRSVGASGSNANSGLNTGISKSKTGGSPGSGSSTVPKQRSSPSLVAASSQSQQKHSSTLVGSSKINSSHNQINNSDKDRQRERERQQRSKAEKLEREKLSNEKKAEEVKRILSGGKPLNTTFQIPKLSSTSSAIKNDDYVMMTSSAKSTGEAHVPQGSKSANASPKYHGVSPKYGGGIQPIFNTSSIMGGNKGMSTSPKLSAGSSPKLASVSPKSGAPGTFTLPNSSASPRYIGGGSVTPPNISPKHSIAASSNLGVNSMLGGSSATQNTKSSPNYTSQQLVNSSDPSSLQKKSPMITSGSKSHLSTQGQNSVGNFKASPVLSTGNSGKLDTSQIGLNSGAKYQTPVSSVASTVFSNSNRSQLDQAVLNTTTELSNTVNLVNQHNQANTQTNENKKPLSQMTGASALPMSIESKGVTDTINKSIIVSNSAASNGGTNSSGKSPSLSLIDDISGQELK